VRDLERGDVGLADVIVGAVTAFGPQVQLESWGDQLRRGQLVQIACTGDHMGG
jgi:hypothetical protein